MNKFENTDGALARYVVKQSQQCLESYRVHPVLIREHANIERATAQGGYGRRQIYELVQNGADALLAATRRGRIHVLLTADALYCANEGTPIDADGVNAILTSHLSMKRGAEIGRFGLGFKSVLGVTRQPQFFSQSGSFGFDHADSERAIREISPGIERVPTLRVATPLDPDTAAEADPILRELMSWATTVVKLPRSGRSSDWLEEDLRSFPAEFLLFSPHVGGLTLQDQQTGLTREIRLSKSKNLYTIDAGNERSTWQVFSGSHSPTAAEREDAGEAADRESIPVIWAVPTSGRSARGTFWAFFPTDYWTSLRGILNAPWKTNEDRQNLLPGVFNEALLDKAAELVVAAIPKLIDADDPARYLLFLPARGNEAPNWADDFLIRRVYARALTLPSLPDQDGKPQIPTRLRLHPAGLQPAWLAEWSAIEGRPSDWVHGSVDASKERRSRAERLAQIDNRTRFAATLATWLEALVEDSSPAKSAAAILLAARIATDEPSLKESVSDARIVLTAGGTLVKPHFGSVFLPSPGKKDQSAVFVQEALAASDRVRQALDVFGVGEVDPAGELQAVVNLLTPESVDARWHAFWLLARRVRPVIASEMIKEKVVRPEGFVKAKTRHGSFVRLSEALLPGRVVGNDLGRDQAATIDLDYHADDVELLESLGATDGPRKGAGDNWASWYFRYESEMLRAYYRTLPPHSSQPQANRLVIKSAPFPGPLGVIERLSPEGSVAFTLRVMELIEDATPLTWPMFHRTQQQYPEIPMPAGWLWMLRQHGALDTSQGIVALSTNQILGPASASLAEFFAVARCDERTARLLSLPADPLMATGVWPDAFARVESQPSDERLGRFYGLAAFRGRPARNELKCRVGDGFEFRATTDVTVVTTRRELLALQAAGSPVLLVDDSTHAERLIAAWGAKSALESVRTEIRTIPAAPPVLLADEYPMLARLAPEVANVELTRCEEIEVQTVTDAGTNPELRNSVLDGKRFFWVGDDDEAALLLAASEALGFDLTAKEANAVVEQKYAQTQRDLVALVRDEEELPQKLVLLLGAERLRRRLPSTLLETASKTGLDSDGYTSARMALAIFGVDTLREFKDDLNDVGLTPPHQWAGCSPARAFVRALGFPVEFAGFEGARRDPIVEVDGPANLPPLHDFQDAIAKNMQRTLMRESGTRGLLSMPTGAGKTRVAVQATIEALEEGLEGPILWVAQSDELCEQAVATWSFVWRAIGQQRQMLISRLWSTNEAVPAENSRLHVVVSTVHKLNAILSDSRYDWLANAGAVIIDEAHTSTAPMYSKVLEWLGLDHNKQARPLVGLSATPFRGTSETETKALANRYGKVRLDAGVLPDDPYVELQRRGVLANVEHRLLEGSEITLTPEELEQLQRTRLMPKSVEERIGADHERNSTIVRSIAELPEDWTVLLFAPSVENAQTMAALLDLEGIPSAAISGRTDPGARRHYIEEFRSGRLRVLTNYNVLTQGFDAPSVRAVFVARPTFSPNLYQQMIGRGLRGPINGGKEECLIVNVGDNVAQYGETLAFRDFEYLWTEDA